MSYAFRGISNLLVSIDLYEARPHKVYRRVNLTFHALPFGRLWYVKPNAVSNAIRYTKFYSRSHRAVIRVYDHADNVDRDARARGLVQRVVSGAKKAATRWLRWQSLT